MNEPLSVGLRSLIPGHVNTTRVEAPKRCLRLRPTSLILVLSAIISLSGCEGFPSRTPEPQAQIEAPPPPAPLPSAKPIVYPSKSNILFAQNTLNKLGYNAGIVDGIWGPQSASAVRNFEKKYQLETANGLLSELNLFMLEKFSNTSRDQAITPATAPRGSGITAKLDRTTPLSAAPQLVILERNYSMLAKPNPFSEVIATLDPGAGVYVISLQEGWYEVESDQQLKGYVKAD